MTNTLETNLREIRMFDVRQARIEAEQLGYTDVDSVVRDAQMLFNENPNTTDWKSLRHYYVIIEGVLTEKQYLFAEYFLEHFSFTNALSLPVQEVTAPETPLDEMSSEELEAEASRLIDQVSQPQTLPSTSPVDRKPDTGPWLRSGHVDAPIVVTEIEEPPRYVAEQLPRQTDEELRKLAIELGLMSLKAPRTKNAFNEYDDGEAWKEDALCASTDPEAFFPEKGGSTREAKRVCAACDVRVECLEFALDHDERFGIWGGLSERERRRLKKLQLAEEDLELDEDDDLDDEFDESA